MYDSYTRHAACATDISIHPLGVVDLARARVIYLYLTPGCDADD
jgi:hypothetical protein